MRISYGRVWGSGYNARTGNNVAICPGGAIRPDSHQKKKKKLFLLFKKMYCIYATMHQKQVKDVNESFFLLYISLEGKERPAKANFMTATAQSLTLKILENVNY